VAAALCATVAIAVPSGCGGRRTKVGEVAPSTASVVPAITKADWLARAQRLCDKYDTAIGAVGGGSDPASRNATATAVLNLIRQHLADLRALSYPPGDRATLEPIFADMAKGLDDVARSGPHPNIEQAIASRLGRDIAKLRAYGSC
jgi:hypothetical protein